MVWWSCLLKNFPQFVVIHTVKGFSVVTEAEVNVLLKFSCFFYDRMDSHSLLQGIFLTQGLNLSLPHWWQILYCLSHQRSPRNKEEGQDIEEEDSRQMKAIAKVLRWHECGLFGQPMAKTSWKQGRMVRDVGRDKIRSLKRVCKAMVRSLKFILSLLENHWTILCKRTTWSYFCFKWYCENIMVLWFIHDKYSWRFQCNHSN